MLEPYRFENSLTLEWTSNLKTVEWGEYIVILILPKIYSLTIDISFSFVYANDFYIRDFPLRNSGDAEKRKASDKMTEMDRGTATPLALVIPNICLSKF